MLTEIRIEDAHAPLPRLLAPAQCSAGCGWSGNAGRCEWCKARARRTLTVSTTVFNRHDLLRELMESIAESEYRPDAVFIVDHAYDIPKLAEAVQGTVACQVTALTFSDPGCALCANWLMRNLPDDRIFVADDIRFTPEAIGLMAGTPGDYVCTDSDDPRWALHNSYACYLLRDSCVEKVGYFDETLSPQYLYFEDVDHRRRMALHDGVAVVKADGSYVLHRDGGSNTIRRYTKEQMDAHHGKFVRARSNYERKWGGGPGAETLTIPMEIA